MLSPATLPTPGDDGSLSLFELLSDWPRRLTRCQLVVLSACSSADGERNEGEGILSIPLGFLQAGSPSVLAATVPVGDEATARFMTAFYEHAFSQRRPDGLAALRNAQRELFEAGEPATTWGPFVWIGAAR